MVRWPHTTQRTVVSWEGPKFILPGLKDKMKSFVCRWNIFCSVELKLVQVHVLPPTSLNCYSSYIPILVSKPRQQSRRHHMDRFTVVSQKLFCLQVSPLERKVVAAADMRENVCSSWWRRSLLPRLLPSEYRCLFMRAGRANTVYVFISEPLFNQKRSTEPPQHASQLDTCASVFTIPTENTSPRLLQSFHTVQVLLSNVFVLTVSHVWAAEASLKGQHTVFGCSPDASQIYGWEVSWTAETWKRRL